MRILRSASRLIDGESRRVGRASPSERERTRRLEHTARDALVRHVGTRVGDATARVNHDAASGDTVRTARMQPRYAELDLDVILGVDVLDRRELFGLSARRRP